MKIGDRVKVKDSLSRDQVVDQSLERSGRVPVLGQVGTIVKPPHTTRKFFVEFDNGTTNGYDKGWFLSKDCLELLDSGVAVEQTNNGDTPPQSTKTMVYRVTIIATPSVVAAQNGAVEEVLVDNATVVANEPYAAAFIAGQENADAKATGKTLRAVVTQV